MRVGFPGGPRLEWYDRDPLPQVQGFLSLQIAPHTTTVRWTYTVPAGKKAWLESCEVFVKRSAAATTARQALACLVFTPSGASEYFLFYEYIWTNNVGDHQGIAVGQMGMLLTGDNLQGRTLDTSTAGTCDYGILCKITEFSA